MYHWVGGGEKGVTERHRERHSQLPGFHSIIHLAFGDWENRSGINLGNKAFS